MNKLGLCNPLKDFPFVIPTKIEYGIGVSRTVVEKVRTYQGSKVMIVTDSGVQKAGLVGPIVKLLTEAGISTVVFDEVEANPRADTVNRAASLGKEQGVDALVAIGGGSSIDSAKAIATVISHGGVINDYEGLEKLNHPVTPIIAIPTTAGTGSEVTFWAIITDTNRKVKMGIGSVNLAPRVALLDPEMTVSLPTAITAATGMDALTHAIESYIARCSNPISDALALYAIELIAKYLNEAVNHGNNLEARGGMLLGSLLAGISFGNADTGAVHSMAEALGAVYDVPHGVANAIFLPYALSYNLPVVTEKIARVGLIMGVESNGDLDEIAKRTIFAIEQLNRDFKIPSLKELAILNVDWDFLSVKAEENLGTPDNPRDIGRKEFLELFKKAYEGEEPI